MQHQSGIAAIPIFPVAHAMRSHRLLDALPPALKTANNLALLQAYFCIPYPNTRRFLLSLFNRIAGDADTDMPFGDISEAEYLLTQYAQLTADMRGKMLTLVQEICAANRGDIGGQYAS